MKHSGYIYRLLFNNESKSSPQSVELSADVAGRTGQSYNQPLISNFQMVDLPPFDKWLLKLFSKTVFKIILLKTQGQKLVL